MIEIDGSFGEGGGQILRTSLGLSLVTGKPVHLYNIRARRKKPGLLAQHLTAVQAAARISNASVQGEFPGSVELSFAPKKVMPGTYRFSVGTAGSATLVLQTILPALMLAGDESFIMLEGGTHNPLAPSYDFLDQSFGSVIRRMGVTLDFSISRYGFYPAGGGRFSARIVPARKLLPLDICERGKAVSIRVKAISSRLPEYIAGDEADIITRALNLEPSSGTAVSVDSPGPGNAVMIIAAYEQVTEIVTGYGQKGVPREKVAGDAIAGFNRYLKSSAPVGIHLADQLLVPFALSGRGCFRTLQPSLHTRTNCEVIRRFLDIDISCTEIGKDIWEIAAGESCRFSDR